MATRVTGFEVHLKNWTHDVYDFFYEPGHTSCSGFGICGLHRILVRCGVQCLVYGVTSQGFVITARGSIKQVSRLRPTYLTFSNSILVTTRGTVLPYSWEGTGGCCNSEIECLGA